MAILACVNDTILHCKRDLHTTRSCYGDINPSVHTVPCDCRNLLGAVTDDVDVDCWVLALIKDTVMLGYEVVNHLFNVFAALCNFIWSLCSCDVLVTLLDAVHGSLLPGLVGR